MKIPSDGEAKQQSLEKLVRHSLACGHSRLKFIARERANLSYVASMHDDETMTRVVRVLHDDETMMKVVRLFVGGAQ